MRRLILAAAFLGIGALAAPAAAPALACEGGSLTVDAGVAYVTDDGGGVWLYLEDNGVAGLQRGGSSLLLGETGPCGVESPDTLIV